MTDDDMASKDSAAELEPRRRYPAPTIDLTATEIEAQRTSVPEAPTAAASRPPEEAAPQHHAADDGAPSGEEPAPAHADPSNGGGSATGFAGWPPGPFWRLIGSGAAGALIMLLIVFGLSFGPSRDDGALSDRLGRIETQLNSISSGATNSGDAALASRVTAAETSLQTLTADTANLSSRVNAATDTARSASARADAAAKAAAQANSASQVEQPESGALSARVAALEAAIAALQNERAANPAGDQATRLAALTTSLRLAVESGNSFTAELNDVKSVIKDPQVLAPLQPFAASGVPSQAELSHDLSALVPALLQAADTTLATGSFFSRLEAHAEHLVRIRPIDAPIGDEPTSVISRIEREAARGDVADALAEFSKLPAPVRAPAEDWIKRAQQREAAIASARAISADALSALTAR